MAKYFSQQLLYRLRNEIPVDELFASLNWPNKRRELATVLEQSAPSPLKWRADIPGDLAQVLLRCLEKQPARRFKNYAELRAALRPFSSEMPTPARLSVRFAAGVIVAVLFRGGLLLAMLGIGAVTSTGQRESRGRMFWRCLLAWIPVFGFPALMALLTPLAGDISLGLLGTAYFALVSLSAFLPDRGLLDRLAGTYLVPR